MRFRWLLGTIALLAGFLLVGDHANAQRGNRKRTQISTRPIRGETAEQESEPAPLRQTAAEAPLPSKRPPAPRTASQLPDLPNDQGQIWREYDLQAYTARLPDVSHPEQAIVDWVLRETGYELWHSEPLAVLSATPTSLRVYHTPEMQRTVADIVDRFVNPDQAKSTVAVRVVSVGSPTWRSRAPARLTPVEVQALGVQAWLLAKEDAAILLADLAKRNDFHEVTAPQTSVPNGQPTVLSAQRSRSYTQHLLPGVAGGSAFAPRMANLDEGLALEVTPLIARDGQSTDVHLRCNIDQVERIFPVTLESGPALLGPGRTKIEVPQRSQLRVKENFRWSAGEVLMISLGVGPDPTPDDGSLLDKALPIPLPDTPSRAETLIFLESRATTVTAAAPRRSAAKTSPARR